VQAFILKQSQPVNSHDLQQLLQKRKEDEAFAYTCKALHLALFGSPDDWQEVRNEVLQMQRRSSCN